MGYNIRYGQILEKRAINEHEGQRRYRLGLNCAFGLIAFMLFVYLCNMESVRSFFLPGDGSVTDTAISYFIEDMQEGASFRDAITAFCLEIIGNANISG